ncbi:MAG TPA: hypothetical protein VL096_09355, partial [Pirellulaceae bacterium]|nr:hypothetical protein [Pirellulaceae bacterium]
THFSIRMLGAASVPMPKIAIAIDSLYFEIKNLATRKTAIYRYTGVGLGAGINKVSATLAGDPLEFQTSGPIFETDFDGFTRFTTAGGGTISANILDMWGTPPGIDRVYLNVPSGFTAGLGASTTVGQMILMWGGND